MIFSNNILIRLTIFILGFCGFMVAKHIFKRKNDTEKPLVCPLKFDCHKVVHSDYSKLFGVPVDIFGMIYYGFISVFYLFFIFRPEPLPFILVNFLITLSLMAFLFSIYLIIVQIFILKNGCFWCIISTFISTFIFILTLLPHVFSSMP
ncbi:hypothetical protein A2641_01950 [Candidatus Nomurabacteria bacterium RIFCSPHIGHO2_01_FULL_37_25]|uniref:Vitamin K epoxide reductase domain-containing protein n=1 Tax=Candidatus Nomurabacteria bacterium RIFCSPLOWO2_01_FULL_36_16 TaxID=1801767 RepID=A0A1F6WYM5_9BACT|nr:MAG: hypothetical protein A2641_01950 [Candidatus Nomurabacteria bacterium RIFCSPHIGHO2_01_FULL_37_25]OGI75756.1 MAG: hypothetical protein A3D36_00110 [Candidatus Nomurabacteria bacterium RIFCSPHIGHO2_02_FULL_36_29]OGI86997.1 MAG: hypothetical protein A3A91_00710 [Candidatus Nomurabacteria bacterium RIFCSPLOWO2_01_FULL_36_16]OGI97049.1 MAG: hypothetical protein A3I84_01900 [Candidatus Nomurabacteria bacterium RIFCSPLOWO2_02_FULL_36_8]